ncbi:MAG: S46 family peptidase [Candidatus Pedobacter colombiensis]|uniref:Dipeptidyl-peptidase n=1 Tax=Candidatus Pedobacter colombiensis TaxID=3121371 RepID=A0AAJ5W7A0_9SPHI|nr:S46 family peptidase [Pedobacter sp.]WEK18476.1 MAG: S46 family peptidase [Pedobacter sp.]
MYKKNLFKWSLLTTFLLSFIPKVHADEGMWLLALLEQNAKEMQAMGLNIPIEKITGQDGALSESVIGFGSGCTGSIVSGSGLILTNYHCAYGAILQYVTPTNDIFQNGYWANTVAQELPVKDLVITVNKKILNVSDEVKSQLQSDASGTDNVKNAIGLVIKKYQQKYPKYRVQIRSYKNDAFFVLFLQLQYKDVRLVGVAPKNVTKFGGETDNWMWPRYSADFAYFRVYADKDGAPAAYSKTNIPLGIKNYLHISTTGYKRGDFAMSMGYPSTSDRDATSYKIKEKTQVLNPPMIAVRGLRQSIWEEEMDKSPLIKQGYAEEYANSANYYKNAVGMNFWVNKLNIIQSKEKYEKEWEKWVLKDEASRLKYGSVLAGMEKETTENAKYKRALTYYNECFSTEGIIRFVSSFGLSFLNYTENLKQRPSLRIDLASTTKQHYRNLNHDVDKRVTKALFKLLIDSLPADLQPEIFAVKKLNSAASIDKYIDEVYKNSVFADGVKIQEWLNKPSIDLKDDPMVLLSQSIEKKQREISTQASSNSAKAFKYTAAYTHSLVDFKGGRYYPDADRTIRLSYGTVTDLEMDGKITPFQTTLNGLMAKTVNTTNKDYFLNKKLESIWQGKLYGKYGVNAEMPVCFVTNGDVTGGNSGSPMLNADGSIIGLVFDCNWESMTREFNFNKDLHRVICVDIRYVLLITEKFSGSDRIIKEIEKANQG